MVTPRNFPYEEEEVARELWAEAVRAYKDNPNFLKTVAPEAAEAIRRAWNSDPNVSKILHFNSIAPLLLGGAAAAGALPKDAEERER